MERSYPMTKAAVQKQLPARILHWAFALLLILAGHGLMAQQPSVRPMAAPLDPVQEAPAMVTPAPEAVPAPPARIKEAPAIEELPIPPSAREEHVQTAGESTGQAQPHNGVVPDTNEQPATRTPQPQLISR